MSGKQAKRLRRAATGLAVALDQEGRNIVERGIVIKEHREINPSVFSSRASDLDQPETIVVAHQRVNRRDSRRGIIRELKRGLAKGLISGIPKS